MHKQPLPRTELRQAILKCMVVSSASLSLAMSAHSSMAQVDTIFTAPPAVCDYIYGVDDDEMNNSQLFRINPHENYQIEPFGVAHEGYDLEALDVSPTGEIYVASGDDTTDPSKAGYLYTVDANTGELTELCATGFAEIDGLSFNPKDVTNVWAWGEYVGLMKITLPGCIVEVVYPERGEVEDLTWGNDGNKLYVIRNQHVDNPNHPFPYTADLAPYLPDPGSDNNVAYELLAYDVVNDELTQMCADEIAALGEIEALEMAEDGTLILGYHVSNNKSILASLDLNTCGITPLDNPRYKVTAATPYQDIEAMGVCAPCIVNPPSTEWMYAKDSLKDATGYPALEIQGLAMKQEGNTIIVAINAGMPPSGWYVPDNLAGRGKVLDGNIGPTDFVIDFDGKKYAVHFSPNNDSGVTEPGLYTQPELVDVTKINFGHPRLDTYLTIMGDEASMGDLQLPTSYFEMKGYRHLPMSIGTATKVEGDNYQDLTQAQLEAMGLNFAAGLGVPANKLGHYTYGFSFNKPADMVDRFVAYLFTECSNDGIAIVGELPDCE